MKNLPLYLIIAVIAVTGCARKNNSTPVVAIDAGLKSNFGYKTGSYWIYKDSVSGETDSAYVYATRLDSGYHGCVLRSGEPLNQSMTISVQVSKSNPLVTELWNFYLNENKFDVYFNNTEDSIESTMHFNLFTWPLATGNSANSGCVLNFDNGAITEIIPKVSVNSQDFSNTARSTHQYASATSNMSYNDCFYVNQQAGLVKIVFDHPGKAVHRVLELQRYKIVK